MTEQPLIIDYFDSIGDQAKRRGDLDRDYVNKLLEVINRVEGRSRHLEVCAGCPSLKTYTAGLEDGLLKLTTKLLCVDGLANGDEGDGFKGSRRLRDFSEDDVISDDERRYFAARGIPEQCEKMDMHSAVRKLREL